MVCYVDRIMRRFVVLALLSSVGLFTLGQAPYEADASKGPRAVFASLAPYYDFMDANLKPWHMKATYQLYDEKGNPAKQGTFEYWWVSPKVYRSTWTSGNSVHSDWHTADGRHFARTSGEPFGIYEYWLQSAWFSPLPTPADLDPSKSIIVDHSIASPNSHSRCFMVVPSAITEAVAKSLPMGTYPEYCVNNARPLLLGYYEFGNLMVRCVTFTQMQGKTIPREIDIIEGSHQLLGASAEPVDTLNPADPALTPPADASLISSEKTQISPAAGSGLLVKKVVPVYPDDAKAAHIHGMVVLETTIGPDGRVQDVRLVSTPSPLLSLPAFQSVSHWQYKPYRVNGTPVSVQTTVEVDFSASS